MGNTENAHHNITSTEEVPKINH